jgi:hypothetical protein
MLAGRSKREEMLAGWKKNMLVRQTEQNKKNSEAAGQGWAMVVQNLPLTGSDYKGTKDVSRMKEAIGNKAKDSGLLK